MFSYYIYCLTKGSENKKIITKNSTIAGGNCVEIVDCDDIQAVMSPVDSDLFNEIAVKENLKNLEWVGEKAIIHESIIEEIMENTPVLPMRFCTVFNSIDSLNSFLKKYYKKIVDSLSIAGKSCEWGVKVYCDRDILKSNIKEMNDIKAEIETISHKTKGVSFMLMKKFEIKLDEYVMDYINKDIQYIFDHIKAASENMVIREAANNDREAIETVFDVIFLVNNDASRYFLDIILDMENEYSHKGYTIKYTGPWPIYNFISFDNGSIQA